MSAERPTGDVALLKIQKPKSASKDIVIWLLAHKAFASLFGEELLEYIITAPFPAVIGD